MHSRAEPVILAALVTEDPLLLIGPFGTGKTYLLNTLSGALGLEHRHYNASLISFDDLVGFRFPEAESGQVKFLDAREKPPIGVKSPFSRHQKGFYVANQRFVTIIHAMLRQISEQET